MSLQERTLVVKNFDPEKTTPKLLKELFLQAGPVRNVVVRPDHAFVEFEDVESVGYSKALLDSVVMFDRQLVMEPKTRCQTHFRYTQILQNYINFDKQQRAMQQQQEALNQQQMIVYNQQKQNQTTIPYQQYGPQPINSSLQFPPVNFIPGPNPRLFDPNAIQPQLSTSNLDPRIFNLNQSTPPIALQQPSLQSYNPLRYPISPIQTDPRMFLPPGQNLLNNTVTSPIVYNQTFSVSQPRLPQQQIFVPNNTNNLDRSRSFNNHRQRPSGKWSRRR